MDKWMDEEVSWSGTLASLSVGSYLKRLYPFTALSDGCCLPSHNLLIVSGSVNRARPFAHLDVVQTETA